MIGINLALPFFVFLLLNMINGQIPVTRGRFLFFGRDIFSLTIAARLGKPVIFGIRPENIHNPMFSPPRARKPIG